MKSARGIRIWECLMADAHLAIWARRPESDPPEGLNGGLPKRRASGPLGGCSGWTSLCDSPPGAGGGPFTAASGENVRDFALTVRKYVREAAPSRKETAPRPRPVWDAVAARVEALLADSATWTGGKQQLTATRLHAMLRAEGKQVGVTVIKAAVAEWRRQRREVFVLLTYRPW